METFNTIVSIAEGIGVIFGLLALFYRPLRERITKAKEKEEEQRKREAAQEEAQKERDEQLRAEIQSVHCDIQTLQSDIDMVNEELLEEKARRARTQILRFHDEICCGIKHSQEHFIEIMDAMDDYNKYCDAHPDFKNRRTVNAQKTIELTYDKCVDKHSFLVYDNDKEEDDNED